MAAPLFELKQVSHQFGQVQALTAISLCIWPGDRVALVGSSGAGKSTLIRLLNGTLRPNQGEVWALGRNLNQLRPARLRQVQSQIGTVYQQLHLVDNLRVVHNVNAGHLSRWSLPKALLSLLLPLELETATQALAQVGIPEKLYAVTRDLSGGQQQRVALARVLVQDPLAILADEPIASLDPSLSREVMDLLRQLCQQAGRTLVVSLHDVGFAQSHCDRIIGLRQGAVVFDCPSPQVSDGMLADLYSAPHE
ncbi:MAG: ATP-binding cassette domain-containing protein [Pegethrix bostrychoides GSE-TBD4-15B]|jgi:phosphonate transport system ATP-binding protein|uniref:ATP-binding cassette domain-containing protein n=1 Tax=Pegethrix bostrychoides GSE-TBD4-15B TaxID=2839662 RepID=A0A951PEW3_9CYAN|nr:ATP-binding cassette domain-containing protein [Pegethrix bostrychoides GSE-TBD4-15B]